MDYAKLRAAALAGDNVEEAVTVDTRALIDKVLARYSGEWTTLRELIQNAADARATTVSVKWETLPSTQVPIPNTANRSEILKHILANHTLRRLVVQNDGQPFTITDWARLKRIAEGNPDETKIGAFGVGFYSVFADCEEPFISSGDQAMAFYWKGNALYTKKSNLPIEQSDPRTTFVLDYRNTTTPLPNLLSVSQFLATSLTFVALEKIEFWIDDYQVLSLQKKSSPSAELTLPRDLETSTKDRLMKVAAVNRTSTQIDALYMNVLGWKPPQVSASASRGTDSYNDGLSLKSFFARLASSSAQATAKAKAQQEAMAAQTTIAEDVTKTNTATIFLRATSASVKTNVTASFASELERATKKAPPKTTRISILTSSFNEVQASEASKSDVVASKAIDVFASVLPSKKAGGRIFIGFPTMQTTGAGLHISAPSVIPTVEREAIDLNARWVKTWNAELLRAAGIVIRLAYANEMEELRQTLSRSATNGEITPELVAKFLPEALHTLNSFTFEDSTPSGQVGQILEEAFWTCFKRASIEMYSSVGVLQTTEIRLSTEDVAKFVSTIPILPPKTTDLPFVKKLIEFGLISHANVTDITRQLSNKALTKAQLIHFMSWLAKKSLSGELDQGSRNALLRVAVADVGEEGKSGAIIALDSITTFLSSNTIPKHLPLPPTTIPHAYTASLSSSELSALGWRPLDLELWLKFLVQTEFNRPPEEQLTSSAAFSVQVLTVISKNWDTVSNQNRTAILALLQARTSMPTKAGMRKPADSFFPSVKLFDDLPVIEGCEKVKEKFLLALGVRKTLDLETIFTRLLHVSDEKGQKKWSHKELVIYLSSVQADIPESDMKKLKQARFCPRETGPKGAESMEASEASYKVSELFQPIPALRALGLPILQWPGAPGSFRVNGPEGLFLVSLGLRGYPSAAELMEMMASSDEKLRESALAYFTANHSTNQYFRHKPNGHVKPFLPIEGSRELVRPDECFVSGASILGFNILRRDLHSHATKFDVRAHPPVKACVDRILANPPKDHATAEALFSYMATRGGELGSAEMERLRGARIVPLKRKIGEKSATGPAYISPERTYLGSSVEWGGIFDFVDFGQFANSFLFQCGAKSEPTKLEIATTACNEPVRLLETLQSPEKYLSLLKSLAEAASTLKRNSDLWRRMKDAPFLLAYREIARPKSQLPDYEEEETAPMRQYQLAPAHQIVILDDIISYRLFKENLKCAPEEDVLEDFYNKLGAERLSAIVQEQVQVGGESTRVEKAETLKKHILERTKLFLHEYAHYRRGEIKHDSRWLSDHLHVKIVSRLSLRRTLKGHYQTHTETRSAASTYDKSQGGILYVAEGGKTDMYQVGQALCQMILNRPNQQAYLFFEPFLALDLYGLRARGYNVDRILRVKAAEARIAEEDRRKALEEEQKRVRENEINWDRANEKLPAAAEAARQEPRESLMPGSWDSPGEEKRIRQDRKGKSLLSHLSRHLGFNAESNEGEAERQLNNFVNNTVATPQASGPSTTKDDGRVTNPALVQQNLLEAINRARAHGSDKVQSQATVKEVKEQSNYCDETPGSNISFIAAASNGVKVFVSKDLKVDATTFLSTHFSNINLFATLLVEVGNIYAISPSVLHIFYDESGPSIAFNTNGSLFCNMRFFTQLHASRLKSPNSGSARAEAGTWWWVVLAHELAHNLVSLHNSEHSYYTESFIQQYMGKMMLQCWQWTKGDNNGQPPSTQGLAPLPSASEESPPPYR